MRKRFVQIDGALVEVSKDWTPEPRSDIHIIPDINPYRAVAVDVATGTAPVISSRSQHREFLRRNGYTEVGNEKLPTPVAPGNRLDSPRPELTRAVRDALRRR